MAVCSGGSRRWQGWEYLGFRKAEADTVGTTDPAEFGNAVEKVNVAEAGAAVSWPERARTDFEDPIVLVYHASYM